MRVIDLASLSLVGGSGIAEAKIPLWSADGTVVGVSIGSAGQSFVDDGGTITSNSASKIFTLSSSWSSTQKFAFEAAIDSGNASATAYFALWDFSLGTPAIVSSSQISTTSTTATVIRSSQFTLTPSHQYGITAWISNTSYYANICDASLIVFPS